MGRKKTLPPSTFVGVLIPNDMLQKIDSMAQDGRKDCSSFSRSEAVRDLLAKSLGVKWKPVAVKVEEEKTVTPNQAKMRVSKWAAKIARMSVEKVDGEHWTRTVARVAGDSGLTYDDVLSLRTLRHTSFRPYELLQIRYELNSHVELYNRFEQEISRVR